MKLKQLIAATALGLASFAASAAPVSLDNLKGALDIKLKGLTTEYKTWTGTNESTWGIGKITSIDGSPGGQTWSAGNNGEYLYYMIYGISDLNPQGTGNNSNGFNIYNVGATGGDADGKIHLDVFRSNVDLVAISDKVADPNLRTSFSEYSLFAGMEKYLQFEFNTGVINQDDPTTPWDERLTTLFQDVTAIVNPASGDGDFYLDVVGGTAKSAWDTNGLLNGTRDAYGKFTLLPNDATPCVTTGTAQTCFQGYINDPILANKIPEPGSLALLGLGFAGLAGLRRRKASK